MEVMLVCVFPVRANDRGSNLSRTLDTPLLKSQNPLAYPPIQIRHQLQ